MIILYHCFNARSFRALWALEELGVDYELRMLPFPPRARAKDYLAENPLGTIPLMLDGPGEGEQTRMTESAAICQYLADRHGAGTLGVPLSDPAYGAYLNYLHFGEATLTFPQTLVLRYGRFEPEERRQPQVVEDYGRWFLARLKAALPALEGGFVCAGRFTAADISVGYALMLADQVGLGAQLPEAARAYWEALKARPAYARAQAAQKAASKAQAISTG